MSARRFSGIDTSEIRPIGVSELDSKAVDRGVGAWTLVALMLLDMGAALAGDIALVEGGVDGVRVRQGSGLEGESCEEGGGSELHFG